MEYAQFQYVSPFCGEINYCEYGVHFDQTYIDP
jgi:hypothetical protein